MSLRSAHRHMVMLIDAPDSSFAAQAERHRRELQVHCYRMLGSYEESEDMVQETFLRAWRKRDTYAGRASFRAWLYRIATNACLDALDRRPRSPVGDEVPWLQPYPDHLLDQLAEDDAGPETAVVDRETIELAFLVAIQHLAPRSRAVLLARDVLGWSAKETAELLDTTVPAVNSALQRAHASMKRHLPERRIEWAPGTDTDAAQRALVQRYIEASERGDADGLAAVLHEEVRFAMPPQAGVWTGRDTVVGSWVDGGFGTEDFGEMRCRVTSANRQPAVACYLRRPGEARHRALAVDVLRIEEGLVADILTFPAAMFPALALPLEL